MDKKIGTALISVYHKTELQPILQELKKLKVQIISTGGTYRYIKNLGYPVKSVEEITGYPSIFGGRVKTLHPLIFGGILMRGAEDILEAQKYGISQIDLVIVDLYPFEETVKQGASQEEIIEKIDIGGVALIRAAAKNFKEVLVISNKNQYERLLQILQNGGISSLEQRKQFALEAFLNTAHYDTAIFHYFNNDPLYALQISQLEGFELRYGENPHQKAKFFGKLDQIFEQLWGKQLSYNNLLDTDAALNLIAEFEEPTVAIIKHTNPCGVASATTISEAWEKALQSDPESAFGGIIVANRKIDVQTAQSINKLFFEIILAPDYEPEALEILKQKKNRRILVIKKFPESKYQIRSILDGYLMQEKDLKTETIDDLNFVTEREPTDQELEDMLFGVKVVKHLKSNAVAIVKNKQLIGSGVGQTSRVDALRQAIAKAKRFGFDLNGAILASDGFFPFADSVELAYNEGIRAVIQPGGSIRDQLSIDFCNQHNMAMVFTGIRHFKH